MAKYSLHIWNIQLGLIALALLFLLWKYLGFAPGTALVVLLVPLWSPLFYVLIGQRAPILRKQAVFVLYLGSSIILIACLNIRVLLTYKLFAIAQAWTIFGFHMGYDIYKFLIKHIRVIINRDGRDQRRPSISQEPEHGRRL
jgi:hypothetical protein